MGKCEKAFEMLGESRIVRTIELSIRMDIAMAMRPPGVAYHKGLSLATDAPCTQAMLLVTSRWSVLDMFRKYKIELLGSGKVIRWGCYGIDWPSDPVIVELE